MIQTIRKKLKSEDGASLMLALLFFVICAMVASVILAAATAAVGSASKKAESDGYRSAVEGVAGILTDQLLNWHYTYKYKANDRKEITEDIAKDWENIKDSRKYQSGDFPTAYSYLAFSQLIEENVIHCIDSTHNAPTLWEKEIGFSSTYQSEIPSVKVEVVKIGEEDQTVILKVSSGTAVMYLTFPGDYQRHSETIDGETIEYAEVTYRTYSAVFNDDEYKPTSTP